MGEVMKKLRIKRAVRLPERHLFLAYGPRGILTLSAVDEDAALRAAKCLLSDYERVQQIPDDKHCFIHGVENGVGTAYDIANRHVGLLCGVE